MTSALTSDFEEKEDLEKINKVDRNWSLLARLSIGRHDIYVYIMILYCRPNGPYMLPIPFVLIKDINREAKRIFTIYDLPAEVTLAAANRKARLLSRFDSHSIASRCTRIYLFSCLCLPPVLSNPDVTENWRATRDKALPLTYRIHFRFKMGLLTGLQVERNIETLKLQILMLPPTDRSSRHTAISSRPIVIRIRVNVFCTRLAI